MSLNDRVRWDARYAEHSVSATADPDSWLVESLAGRPPGRALDLACGLGHNAIWLAGQGWTVDAVDVSPVGLELARQSAQRQSVTVDWIAADLDEYEPSSGAYDLVCVFRFLDRARLPCLIETALCPGGLLIYETFTLAQLDRPDNHMRNPAFLLRPGELPQMFQGLESIAYREVDLGDRSVAQWVAAKP